MLGSHRFDMNNNNILLKLIEDMKIYERAKANENSLDNRVGEITNKNASIFKIRHFLPKMLKSWERMSLNW